MSSPQDIIKYWHEAEALADTLMPIPPIACLDSAGQVVRTDRCFQCPMQIQCKLKEMA